MGKCSALAYVPGATFLNKPMVPAWSLVTRNPFCSVSTVEGMYIVQLQSRSETVPSGR